MIFHLTVDDLSAACGASVDENGAPAVLFIRIYDLACKIRHGLCRTGGELYPSLKAFAEG